MPNEVKESFDIDPSENVAAKVIAKFLALISALIKVLINCTTTLKINDCVIGMIRATSYDHGLP